MANDEYDVSYLRLFDNVVGKEYHANVHSI